MSIRNSERFLTAYNRIEKSMEKTIGFSGYMPFYKLIDRAKKENAIVRKFEDDLREYAGLRNAIVHHRTEVEYAKAEPHDDIVELIEYIDKELSKPKTVGEMFQRKVHTLRSSDTLDKVLKLILEKRFNQIPIYEDQKFIGLITSEGITYWLAAQYAKGDISREIPTLLDMYCHENKKNTYRFINRELSVYEAEEIFKESVVKGKRLDALLITENGQVEQKLLGIITPLDLMKID